MEMNSRNEVMMKKNDECSNEWLDRGSKGGMAQKPEKSRNK